MGLTSSLQIGRSALTASQVALQVTGNNFANASTPGYSRQVTTFSPIADSRSGGFLIGRGVQVQGINRQIDSALQARLWSGVSQEAAAGVNLQLLSTLQSTLNELTDNDLSSEFSRFFDSWSELSNSPNREGARSLVVQQGRTLAASIRNLRSDLTGLRSQIDAQLESTVSAADGLLSQIADLNTSIVQAEAGTATANGLRDQRDTLVGELSRYMDISTVEQANGTLDVLIGSTPVVLAGLSRGIELTRTTNGDQIDVSVNVKADNTNLDITAGSIGGLFEQRGGSVDETIERLDGIATQLIFQLNRLHSTGHGAEALTSVTGTQAVSSADITRAFNDPANTTFDGLPFGPTNGGFFVTVTNTTTGATSKVRIELDLDGIDNTGVAGFGDDTSVQSLASDLGAIPNLTASLNADGTLQIDAAAGYTFGFSEDSSGVLATLGVNTYFTGTTARDIDVRQGLIDRPSLLSTGQSIGGNTVDNGAALAILGLRDQSNSDLGGETISTAWLNVSQNVGSRADAAGNRAQATSLVRESLEAQRAAVSGVSIDEESINLLNYQRQYQGAARFISVIDELTQTLLSLV